MDVDNRKTESKTDLKQMDIAIEVSDFGTDLLFFSDIICIFYYTIILIRPLCLYDRLGCTQQGNSTNRRYAS